MYDTGSSEGSRGPPGGSAPQRAARILPRMSAPRTWLITGVSSGFGRALAQAALARGDRVAGTLRQAGQLDDFRGLAPDRAVPVYMDVTDGDAVERGVREAVGALGHVDVLVNNAGYGLTGAIEELDDRATRDQFEANVFGALAVTRAVLPHMRARRTGTIVQVSSMAALRPRPGLGVYAASKAALEAISEALALEVAPLGIRVLILEPGAFRTDWAGRSMVHVTPIDDYDETVRPTRERLARLDGIQVGDPARAAQAIIEAVDSAEAPLRLALGGDAVDLIRDALAGRSADVAAWEQTSRGTDFPA
jgi:NAD(P)-dependent dehydrogenase (short-subunit alcohol dehydrogenase family)